MSIRFLVLTVAPVVLGVGIGYLLGGRLAGFRTLRIRALWLLWAATGVQLLHYRVDGGPALLAAVFTLVLVWFAVNLRHWPAALRLAGGVIVVGAVLNAVPIALNGRMPYDPAAVAAAGLEPGIETPKNEPADARTRLAALGDTIAVPVLRKVVSPGDLLIGGGAAALIALAMRRHRRTGVFENGEPAHDQPAEDQPAEDQPARDEMVARRPGVDDSRHVALHDRSAA